MRWLLALLVAAFAWTLPAFVRAHEHVARSGETLESLAALYYGAESQAMTIRAANGFLHPDDGRLIEGERVKIPEITYYRVRAQDTWESIAEKFLGSSKRGAFLAEMNGAAEGSALAEGQIVKVPYQLLYVLAPDESLKTVAAQYLGPKFSAQWLGSYNFFKKKKKLGRGDALLVPLVNAEFTDAGKKRAETSRKPDTTAEDQEFQARATKEIAALRDDYGAGQYLRVVASANRLLGTGRLTVPQQVGVLKFLASSYIAFGEQKAAVEAFREALVLQPDMELSAITTSPKVLDAFREALKSAKSGSKK